MLIFGKGLPIQEHLPLGGLVQILQQGSHCALPRPIGPHQRRHLTRTKGERQTLEATESHTLRGSRRPLTLRPVSHCLVTLSCQCLPPEKKGGKCGSTATTPLPHAQTPPHGVEMEDETNTKAKTKHHCATHSNFLLNSTFPPFMF